LVGFDNAIRLAVRLQFDHAIDNPLINGANSISRIGETETVGKIDRFSENDNRAAEQAARQPAPYPLGLRATFAENSFDTMMIDGNDDNGGFRMGDGEGRTVLDGRQIVAALPLVEDEQVVPFEEIDVFPHEPGMIAPFDRDGAQKGKENLEKPEAKEILLSREIDEQAGGIDDVFGEMSGHPDQKRIIHGFMIRDKEDTTALFGNVYSSSHAGEIEREHEKQETRKPRGNHGDV
jgi:hypothetical protein